MLLAQFRRGVGQKLGLTDLARMLEENVLVGLRYPLLDDDVT